MHENGLIALHSTACQKNPESLKYSKAVRRSYGCFLSDSPVSVPRINSLTLQKWGQLDSIGCSEGL